MGVKFNREYRAIHAELTNAILSIDDAYEMLEMSPEDWAMQAEHDRVECIKTLADDVFYGLGGRHAFDVGSGKVEYDASNHLIKVQSDEKVIHMIKLV